MKAKKKPTPITFDAAELRWLAEAQLNGYEPPVICSPMELMEA